MEINRNFVRLFTFVAGPMVLVSYVLALSKMEDGTELWGGIPSSWTTYIVPFMFLAAIGFLMYWWVALFKIEISVLESLRWPWGESDGRGTQRLLLSYALFLIPSMLWIDSTRLHINNGYSWTPFLVIGILALASVGNILFGLLAYAARKDGVEGSGLMLLGSIFLGIQVIVNDLIVWSVKFPWQGRSIYDDFTFYKFHVFWLLESHIVRKIRFTFRQECINPLCKRYCCSSSFDQGLLMLEVSLEIIHILS